MASPSTGHMLTEPGQVHVFNGVSDDEIIGEFNSVDDTVFDSDYTQSETPRTRVINDNEKMIFLGTYSCHQKESKTSKRMCDAHKTWEKIIYLFIY